jgi:hypothetical protein
VSPFLTPAKSCAIKKSQTVSLATPAECEPALHGIENQPLATVEKTARGTSEFLRAMERSDSGSRGRFL